MIKIVDLTKVYLPKKGVSVTALNNVNLEFSETGMVFLLGKSGSGKSTLLNLIGGLDSYTDGDIIIKGKSTKNFNQSNFDSYRNTLVGFVFQEFNILEEYSVGKNIGLALELQHKPSDKGAVDEMLAKVDLEGYYDRKPNELSGGQKQRVAIARALIKNPDIIMADEPTGALDSVTGGQVFDTLKKLSQEKLVIVVSHDRENAEVYGDRIVELEDGNVISDRIRNAETGRLAEKTLAVIDEKLIRVKGGKKLSDEEIELIANAISKSTDDVYLSVEPTANLEFSKKTELFYRGTSTFTETTKESISLKEYDAGELKLTKSRMPIKDSFKMGASGLTHKKFRLSISIILSFFTFVMIGFCLAASFFDGNKVEVKTAYDANLTYSIVRKSTGDDRSVANGFTAEEIVKLEQLTGEKAVRLYGSYYGSRFFLDENFSELSKTEEEDFVYYTHHISNFAIITSEDQLGLTPIGNSRLPTAKNEIAITDYTADSFIKYGYTRGVGSEKETIKIDSAEQMIGKQISSYKNVLTITGVYKTPIEKEQFNKYKTMKRGLISDSAFDSTGILLGCGFVSPQFEISEDSKDATNYTKLDMKNGKINIDYEDTNLLKPTSVYYNATDLNLKKAAGFDGVVKENQIIISETILKDIEIGEKTFTAEEFLSLAPSERTITLKYIGAELKSYALEVVAIDCNIIENEQIYVCNESIALEIQQTDKQKTKIQLQHGYQMATKNYTEQLNVFEVGGVRNLKEYNNSDKTDIYWGKTGDIANQPRVLADDEVIISNSVFLNAFSSILNSLSKEDIIRKFDELTTKEILLCYGDIRYYPNGKNLNNDTGKSFKIVGVSLQKSNDIYVSDSYFNKFLELDSRPKNMIISLPTTADGKAQLKKLLKAKSAMDEYGIRESITLQTHVSELLRNATSIVKPLAKIFQYVAIGLCVFAAILMMNFISTSISYKKKEIGVLRAIGARSVDVFKIFFAESSLIALIITVLSWIALTILAIVINSFFMVSILVLNPLVYIIMAVLCLAIAFIATCLPILKIAKMKPIDAIRNK